LKTSQEKIQLIEEILAATEAEMKDAIDVLIANACRKLLAKLLEQALH
jgi:hypothetical protein